MATPRRYDRAVFIPDVHVPFSDPGAVRAALGFIKHVDPHIIIQLGDLVDFYALSRFSREPSRVLSLQPELDAACDFFGKVRDAAPNSRIYYLRGNHEYRLTRYLWDRAPEVSGLRGLKLPELMNLKWHGVEYVESGVWDVNRLFVAKHGNLARSRSGATAGAEMDRLGFSGVSGHTHRLGQVYRRVYGGEYTWLEAGCLCDRNPEYLEGQTPDWQHGMAWGEIARDRFHCGLVPIISGRITWGGMEIGRDGGKAAKA